jgi:hypothetical protein
VYKVLSVISNDGNQDKLASRVSPNLSYTNILRSNDIMTFQLEEHPLTGAYAAILSHGLDGAGEALRILVNEASKIERAQHLNAYPFERSEDRTGYANGFKPKTVLTRMGELTFSVPQVRDSSFYTSALEKGTRTEQCA